jgi:acyl-CoA thioesterase FadM
MIKVFFLSPVYAQDVLSVKAVVDQVSTATRVVIMKVTITRIKDSVQCLKGQIQVGFTDNA